MSYDQLTSDLMKENSKLKAELAYLKLQRDSLLDMTWLDLPDEPSESTAKWKELFNKGWERREMLVDVTLERDALLARVKELEAAGSVMDVFYLRCQKHKDVPQINFVESDRAECGACIAAERDALQTRVEKLETDLRYIATMPEYDQDDSHRLRNLARFALTPGAAIIPAAPCRHRKPRPAPRYNDGRPAPFTSQQLEDRIDKLCGCAGKNDCDCVSVFTTAEVELWTEAGKHPAPNILTEILPSCSTGRAPLSCVHGTSFRYACEECDEIFNDPKL